jgi:hypothetical protein
MVQVSIITAGSRPRWALRRVSGNARVGVPLPPIREVAAAGLRPNRSGLSLRDGDRVPYNYCAFS